MLIVYEFILLYKPTMTGLMRPIIIVLALFFPPLWGWSVTIESGTVTFQRESNITNDYEDLLRKQLIPAAQILAGKSKLHIKDSFTNTTHKLIITDEIGQLLAQGNETPDTVVATKNDLPVLLERLKFALFLSRGIPHKPDSLYLFLKDYLASLETFIYQIDGAPEKAYLEQFNQSLNSIPPPPQGKLWGRFFPKRLDQRRQRWALNTQSQIMIINSQILEATKAMGFATDLLDTLKSSHFINTEHLHLLRKIKFTGDKTSSLFASLKIAEYLTEDFDTLLELLDTKNLQLQISLEEATLTTGPASSHYTRVHGTLQILDADGKELHQAAVSGSATKGAPSNGNWQTPLMDSMEKAAGELLTKLSGQVRVGDLSEVATTTTTDDPIITIEAENETPEETTLCDAALTKAVIR